VNAIVFMLVELSQTDSVCVVVLVNSY